MKANELMIGDWVYNTHHKKNIQITAYDFFTHHHNNDGTQSFLGIIEPKTTRGFDLKPIPLTDEMLKANGWSYKDCDGCYSNNKVPFCFNIDEVAIDVRWDAPEVYCLYVHELQHALRLCGLDELADNFKLKEE